MTIFLLFLALTVAVLAALPLFRRRPAGPLSKAFRAHQPSEALTTAREFVRQQGGTVFLGLEPDTERWLTATPQQSVLVLGPPRSGKTSTVIGPSILVAPGPVVSTSTKLDVLHDTAPARARLGRAWHYDPTGAEVVPDGVNELRRSPLQTSTTWTGARLMANEMVDAAETGHGTENASFWANKAKEVLAPLLYAAAISNGTIRDVHKWITTTDIDEPIDHLIQAAEAGDDAAILACRNLQALDKPHGERLRGDIFATTQPVLWPYGSVEALNRAATPNFDPDHFVTTPDTLYITAPANLQHLCSPLVVGLLTDIQHATYRRHRLTSSRPNPPVLWALDEAANIARFGRFPNLIAEAGGQGLQVLACFQSLAQARERWNTAADGFLTLFNTKVIFGGIGDLPTLQALSALTGDWDRPQVTITNGRSHGQSWGWNLLNSQRSRTHEHSESVAYNRTSQLSPGDIAAMNRAQALILTPDTWQFANNQPLFTPSHTAQILHLSRQPGPDLVESAHAIAAITGVQRPPRMSAIETATNTNTSQKARSED